ncbi:HAD family hydrolase [Streptomyces sp. NPDC001904]|uniref:HAD family hydrolase n=1 Tax=Streptomyces sp. NPDC001904 TaxID=3154531 RepID=UPI00333410B9
MPLLLLDLDNTLVDRDAAFRSAMAEFLAGHGLPAEDLAWIMAVDDDGYAARPAVASALSHRYGTQVPPDAVRDVLDRGAADRVTLAAPVRTALVEAAGAGWTPVVVTNGRTAQQTRKIRRTGLDALVDGWAISEAVGHAKPSPEIFRAAAAGRPLRQAWMVGDAARTDIAGARALGLRSVWLARGRTWQEREYAPTHIAGDVVAALEHVIGQER